MAEEQLRKAFGLMKRGQSKEALAIVQTVLKQDKNNVPAWWLMTNLLADDPERQKKALERVLALDPKHKLALQMQSQMNKGTSPAPKQASAPKVQAQPDMKSTEEMNLDWSKIEAKEAGKKAIDDEATSKTVQTVTYLMIGFVVVVIIGLGLMWAIPAYQFSQINNPHDTVLRFYTAFLSRDYPTARLEVCPDVIADFTTFRDLNEADFEARSQQFGEDAVFVYDFSAVTVEVLSDDGTNATARLSGQYTLSSPTTSDRVDTITIVASEGDEEVLKAIEGDWCIAKIQ